MVGNTLLRSLSLTQVTLAQLSHPHVSLWSPAFPLSLPLPPSLQYESLRALLQDNIWLAPLLYVSAYAVKYVLWDSRR
jgi:hypothetical protein